jgi:hypothetical protein
METNFRRIDMVETPIRTAFELDTEGGQSDLELSKSSILDLKANPTQPVLEVEEVETRADQPWLARRSKIIGITLSLLQAYV